MDRPHQRNGMGKESSKERRIVMKDDKCAYYQEGYCLKGLVGTKCELEGCVAHMDRLTIKRH